MFTIKNAIMEILNKSKSLDKVLETLSKEDQATLLATFDMMKAKLGGSVDIIDTQDNGQWSLTKNTLDYSKINKPKVSNEPEHTIDYSGPDFKPASAGAGAKPKSWDGAVARRDAVRSEHQKWKDKGSIGSGETDSKNALDAIRDRQSTKKSEDAVQQIKDKYAEKKPKSLSVEVTEVKERELPKPPKTDEEKANEAKKKFRQESKIKADAPFKSGVNISRKQQS